MIRSSPRCAAHRHVDTRAATRLVRFAQPYSYCDTVRVGPRSPIVPTVNVLNALSSAERTPLRTQRPIALCADPVALNNFSGVILTFSGDRLHR
jgi:hypothetical protein